MKRQHRMPVTHQRLDDIGAIMDMLLDVDAMPDSNVRIMRRALAELMVQDRDYATFPSEGKPDLRISFGHDMRGGA